MPLVVEANAFECVGRCLWLWSATYDIHAGVRAKSELQFVREKEKTHWTLFLV